MTWNLQPTLVGEKVTLEPLRPYHAAGYLAAADDDAIFTYLSRPRPSSIAHAAEIIASFVDDPAWNPLAQIDSVTGELMGMTTLYDVNDSLQTLAIGATWLSRSRWRTGVNREAKRLLLTHVFEALGCVRVVWHVDQLNERSLAAVEALGAVREGVQRKHRRRRDGSWRDTVVFSMLDSEWPAVREALTS